MNGLEVQLRSMKILADAKRPAARICVLVQELNSYQQLENFKNLGSNGISHLITYERDSEKQFLND